ncbi:MAG: tRNA (adenosine(37)-N6)-threonylcarbamoyltransferase complex ATPase subunit type 1 TsaE [Firmicutes bacterium]|nr:tRNA (adenosine(37)-N6)-threonylcarbamoyltransferase complex ATPase subunit type 1 TsaE [Bacillota bacterium]MDY5770709.1 tRNA (adenosine(37)-N6)-threonylcarbamoyltransferase complex ATPase subunit type 1 TsaE [Anaerovoracaceae bacterium]
MEIKRTLKIKNEEETRRFGLDLAHELKAGDVVALIGDLGTGKTALTRYIAEGLGITARVNSPTFTIVKEYRESRLPLFHFDVYRVSDPDELFNIGADEYFYGDGVCVVEWADLIEELLPEDTRYIYIEYGPKEGERIYKCSF